MALPIAATNELYNTVPYSQITGFPLVWASNTTLTLGAGQSRDSTNQINIISAAPITINSAINGVNGLDTGTIAANTLYYVYIVSDPSGRNAPCGLLSLSATTPVLPANTSISPSNYGAFRRVGVWSTDGSAHFNLMTQVGNGSVRDYVFDTLPVVLTPGTATTFTAVNLAPWVPAQNTFVTLMAAFTPTTAGHIAQFRASGSTATTVATISGAASGVLQEEQITIMTGVVAGAPKIDYLVQDGGMPLSLYSFKDYM